MAIAPLEKCKECKGKGVRGKVIFQSGREIWERTCEECYGTGFKRLRFEDLSNREQGFLIHLQKEGIYEKKITPENVRRIRALSHKMKIDKIEQRVRFFDKKVFIVDKEYPLIGKVQHVICDAAPADTIYLESLLEESIKKPWEF